MNPILTLENVKKNYKDFSLDISLSLEHGSIIALVGENGAGKTTLIKSIFGLVTPDEGTIKYKGKDVRAIEKTEKDEMSVSFDEISLPPQFTAKEIEKYARMMFQSWDDDAWNGYLRTLNLPSDKKLGELSKGMKAKMCLAYSLSRHPKLLVLDELTSSMDPVVRDEVLSLLQGFVEDEDRTVLISSHLTSDLEKIADRIIFIHEGHIYLDITRDELDERYGIIRGCKTTAIDPAHLIAKRERSYSVDYLIDNKEEYLRHNPDAICDNPTIEEIMLTVIKKEDN